MAALTIQKLQSTGRLDTMRIGGFNNGELSELKSMEHYESKSKLLDMLDDRNHGLGLTWMAGPGVYGHWFDNEYAYVNIGKSCD